MDVLVNCAGIEVVGPLLETDEDTLRNLFDVNVFGTWRATRAAVPNLGRSPHPAIVNISSAAGLNGSPMLAGYSMSKAAVIRMTEALAVELRPAAMGVPIEEILTKQGGRIGRADEVAEVVAILASDRHR